jgi:hypothetical protein
MAAKMTKKSTNSGHRTQKTSRVTKKQIVKKPKKQVAKEPKKQVVMEPKKQVIMEPKNPVDDILPYPVRLLIKKGIMPKEDIIPEEDIKPKRIRLLVREPVPPKERIVIRIPAKYLTKTEDE